MCTLHSCLKVSQPNKKSSACHAVLLTCCHGVVEGNAAHKLVEGAAGGLEDAAADSLHYHRAQPEIFSAPETLDNSPDESKPLSCSH